MPLEAWIVRGKFKGSILNKMDSISKYDLLTNILEYSRKQKNFFKKFLNWMTRTTRQKRS